MDNSGIGIMSCTCPGCDPTYAMTVEEIDAIEVHACITVEEVEHIEVLAVGTTLGDLLHNHMMNAGF